MNSDRLVCIATQRIASECPCPECSPPHCAECDNEGGWESRSVVEPGFPVWVRCPACDGGPFVPCSTCNGAGEISAYSALTLEAEVTGCSDCLGTGRSDERAKVFRGRR